MPDQLLTKCPHCGTTFRITLAQLKVAGGAVRCGACYHVFHATGHLIKGSASTSPDSASSNSASNNPPLRNTAKEPIRSPSSFDNQIPDLDDATNTNLKLNKKSADESWAETMLKEMGEAFDDDLPSTQNPISSDNIFDLEDLQPATQAKKATNKPANKESELSETFQKLGSFASDDPFAIHDIPENDLDEDVTDDESWAKSMLEELEQEQEPATSKGNEFSILGYDTDTKRPYSQRDRHQENFAASFATPNEHQQKRQDSTQSAIKHINPLHQGQPKSAAKPKPAPQPAVTEDELEEFTPGALYVDQDDIRTQHYRSLRETRKLQEKPSKTSSRAGQTLGFTLGSLILMLALAAQYGYFNFSDLAHNHSLRPLLEKLCQPLHCILPHRVDVSKIVGTKLVVHSHPQARNALKIDAIVKNLAAFEQPFPLIELRFEDINGNPVASRQFQPTEYIQDPAVDINLMPRNTPIHLNLEIVDPGKNAVNYQLHFKPSTQAS